MFGELHIGQTKRPNVSPDGQCGSSQTFGLAQQSYATTKKVQARRRGIPIDEGGLLAWHLWASRRPRALSMNCTILCPLADGR